jgi:hypothetical protein
MSERTVVIGTTIRDRRTNGRIIGPAPYRGRGASFVTLSLRKEFVRHAQLARSARFSPV